MRDPHLLFGVLAALAAVGGLGLLVRGLLAYRSGERVRGIGTSQVESVAAGEARLVGVIEAGPITLVSPLQSEPCVYYRSRIVEGTGDTRRTTFADERAVGFGLRDATGRIRVFPGGAGWDAPECFDASTSLLGDEPPGLRRNAGPSTQTTIEDREAAIANLLTVHVPESAASVGGTGTGTLGLLTLGADSLNNHREYHERRLAPGDTVTIVGAVLPYRDIEDPATADQFDPAIALDDPLIAEELAEARAAGLLRTSAAEAWGNADIPGFGIGRPTRPPDLDPAATEPAIAPQAAADHADAIFDVSPDELVVAKTPDTRLVIRAGTPSEAVARDQGALLLGLVGGLAAIAGAVVLALLVEGQFG
jgi:hypothetical protein